MEQTKMNKMGSSPMLKLILSMSLPAMFSMLVQSLYNVVDSYFVSQISENALTAVSLAFPAQMLMISVAVGTGTGINSLVSRRLGEGKKDDADKAATHGIILGIVSWLVFALGGLFFTQTFFQMFTSNQAVTSLGGDYFYIVTVFSVGLFVEINLEKTLQATGNMIFPMVFQLIGAVTNIILDPILIFGYFGAPEMGVTGAAVATVAGQILSMIFALYICLFRKHDVHIGFKGFRLNGRTIRDIYAVGLPSMVMMSISSVLLTGMNFILIAFSETAVAVFGIYFKLQSFIFMPVFGLTQGIMPIMGYNYGAGNRKRLISALKIGSVIALIIMAIGTLIFLFLPEQMLQIFNASPQMLEIGVPALQIISLSFIPAALGITYSTLFQAVGMGGKSLIISILRQIVIILPVAYMLSHVNLNTLWYAFPIAELICLGASIVFYIIANNQRFKHLTPIRQDQQ